MDINKEKKPFLLIRPIVYFFRLDADEKGTVFLWLSFILFLIFISIYIFIKFGMLNLILTLSVLFFFLGGLFKLFGF